MAPKSSRLTPFSDETVLALAKHMHWFFSPVDLDEKNKTVGINHTMHTEWTLYHFILYLQNKHILQEALLYSNQIHSLARKLVNAGILHSLGYLGQTPMFDEGFFSMKELTELESVSDFWLSGILGERYLRNLTKGFIVRIEGTTRDAAKTSATGSGVLIANNLILTCAHNINDIEISAVCREEEELHIISKKPHPEIDLGIIEVQPTYDAEIYPYFGDAYVLDKTLTMGYPPARGMRGTPLIAQSGEINAIEKELFTGSQCITISSTTRPGNSGGPVFSLNGYIVGIVISSATAVEQYGVDFEKHEEQIQPLRDTKQETPFYLALSSQEINARIHEIDPNITLRYEMYK